MTQIQTKNCILLVCTQHLAWLESKEGRECEVERGEGMLFVGTKNDRLRQVCMDYTFTLFPYSSDLVNMWSEKVENHVFATSNSNFNAWLTVEQVVADLIVREKLAVQANKTWTNHKLVMGLNYV